MPIVIFITGIAITIIICILLICLDLEELCDPVVFIGVLASIFAPLFEKTDLTVIETVEELKPISSEANVLLITVYATDGEEIYSKSFLNSTVYEVGATFKLNSYELTDWEEITCSFV